MKFRNLSFSFSATSLRETGKTGIDECSETGLSATTLEQNALGQELLDADPFEVAGTEFLNGKVVPGLWARATVEGDGDDGRTRAAYIRLRVEDLQFEIDRIRQEKETAARLLADREEGRRREVTEFASENRVSFDEAEAMIEHHIKKEGDKFALYLDGGALRYSYDRLDHAIQYSKDWTKLRVPPPPTGKS